MLLNITALTKTYTISGKLIIALNTVDLTFSENSFTCIVGKSGCGKTTLLRLLWLTVNANIAFAAKNDPSLPAAPDEKLLELLGLKAFQHSFPAQLSGGMAQRTALGRTLFQNPDLILMDEPFSALDYFTRRSLQQMLLNLFQQQKKSVIFVTHDVEEALLLGQRILVMQEGRIKIDQRIDMEYPRQQASLSFQQLRLQILSAIEN